jgi:hypothetical protein
VDEQGVAQGVKAQHMTDAGLRDLRRQVMRAFEKKYFRKWDVLNRRLRIIRDRMEEAARRQRRAEKWRYRMNPLITLDEDRTDADSPPGLCLVELSADDEFMFEEVNCYLADNSGRIIGVNFQYAVGEENEDGEPLAYCSEDRRMRVVRQPDGRIDFIGDYTFARGEEAEALAYARVEYGN